MIVSIVIFSYEKLILNKFLCSKGITIKLFFIKIGMFKYLKNLLFFEFLIINVSLDSLK